MAATHGFRAGDLTNRRELQKLLASTLGSPEEYAIKLALLKSLMRARYATTPLGHFGLAKVNYTHFTSPIRRYADLLVHRSLVREKVGSMSELGEITEHISTTERTSSDAERDSTMLKKMEFFLRQLAAKRPDEFRAIVVDVRSYGLVVELPDCLVTGLIHVSALPDDFYSFDSVRLAFVGRRSGRRYSLGAEVKVIISRVDAYKRQLDFAPVGEVRPGTTRQPEGRSPVARPQERPRGQGDRKSQGNRRANGGGGKPKQRGQRRRR